jgi:hypothetical protein
MHYLVIDDRFRVPVFVFLELDPRRPGADPGLTVRWVSLDLADDQRGRQPHDHGAGVRPNMAIGRDPERLDRFLEFPSEGHVRAAGFTLIEPRYVGPTWETYLSVFRPEGERRSKVPAPRPRTSPRRPAGRPTPRPAGAHPERS